MTGAGYGGQTLRARELAAMQDRTLITAGAIGAVVAAVCCATPLPAVLLGAVGLTAWVAKADCVVIPVLILCIALIGIGLYRQRLLHR